MASERIIILGGGMAGLVAAFELSSAPDWRARYELTVYQSGHRLGGKGASGRAGERFDRIEEHGLHLFYGFYDNAFSVMRRCYEELGRAPGAPLATLEEAFQPHSLVVFEEQHGGWQHQPLLFPCNGERPGSGQPVPTPRELIPIMLRFLVELFETQRELAASTGASLGFRAMQAAITTTIAELEQLLAESAQREALLGAYLKLSRRLWRIAAPLVARRPRLRSAWSAADLTLVMIRGMIADGLVEAEGFDWRDLDHEDFRTWLRRHGACEATLTAGTLTGVYAGAYSKDIELGAGTALHWTLRMLYTYRGAIFYKMQAGMGDVVFAPLYEVLLRRGVEFRFFHRVDALRLSGDRRRVAAVELARQVALVDEPNYDPLVDVDGLPCWPSEPRYEQLVDGEALRESGECLEAWGCRWPDAGAVRLEQGRDFDRAILAVGLGVVPSVCGELLANEDEPGLARMVDAVETTMTVSAQLWMRPPLAETGWHLPPPVMIPYADPLDTWCDMSHLLERERFPGGEGPRSLAYLTAAMPDAEPVPRSREDFAEHAARQRARIEALTARHLRESAEHLWPQLCGAEGLDLDHLWAPPGGDALLWQHFSPMHHPSDRYVRSPRGTTRKRLAADESGYGNLVLAGDWTSTPMNLGCVEAATMAGIRAAQVIAPTPIAMHGDWMRGSVAWREGGRAPGSGRRYIERRTNESTSPPYVARDSVMVSALLPADRDRLRACCDRYLNLLDDRVYLPLGAQVVFYAQDNPKLAASDAPGTIHERDFGFMIPLVICARTPARAGLRPLAIGAFVPHLWVDAGAAVYGGREVLGFPKGQGVLGFEASGGGELSLSIDSWVPPLAGGPGAAWAYERILEVSSSSPAGGERLGGLFAALRGGLDVRSLARAGLDRAARSRLVRLLTDTLRSGRLDFVFLKQYRDATDPRLACYRAIVEAPCERLGDAHRGAWMDRSVELSFAPGLGVVEELGLAAELDAEDRPRVRAHASYYMELDFRIGTGTVWPCLRHEDGTPSRRARAVGRG